MKKCTKCSRRKSAHLFSGDKKRPDGKYPYCKACVRAEWKKRYAWKEQTPEYKAMRRRWRQTHRQQHYARCLRYEESHRPERRRQKRERYAKFRNAELSRAKRVREKFKDHCRARWALAQQIRYHGLKREPCKDCGARRRVQAHHHKGYDKVHWLDVVWLCSVCHGRRHRAEA